MAELFVAPKQVSRARGVPSGHDRRVRLLLLAHALALEAHVSQGAQGAASAGAAVSRIAGRTTTRDAPPVGRIYAQTWPRGGFIGFGFVSIRSTNDLSGVLLLCIDAAGFFLSLSGQWSARAEIPGFAWLSAKKIIRETPRKEKKRKKKIKIALTTSGEKFVDDRHSP